MTEGAVNLSSVFHVDGEVKVPGDKSISHRALIIGGLARGRSFLSNLAPGDDVARTASCLDACGVGVRVYEDGRALIEGMGGEGALRAPSERLDCGNSGSTMRLLAGALAGHDLTASLDGDASLRRRPMRRVAEPLQRMGAAVRLSQAGTAPMTIAGRRPLLAIEHQPAVASAQVKSAVLFAGLAADGPTTVVEPQPTRDHTERLLRMCGVSVDQRDGRVTVHPGEPQPFGLRIPGDLSSAAFFLCLAAARNGWRARCPAVGINPGRTGVLEVLRRMGALVEVGEIEPAGGSEPVADLEVSGRGLAGIVVGGDLVPSCIDELPVIAVIATQAQGTTLIRDAGELRHKESDRIGDLAAGLRQLGAACEILPDGLAIEGPTTLHPASVDAAGDHRLAMAFAVAASLAVGPGTTRIGDASSASVSYPRFLADLASLTRG